jgi:hypothetical protein
MTRDQWTLDVPDAPYATPNSRQHAAKRGAMGAVWREATAWIALAQKVPKDLQKIRVQLVMLPADARARDEDNLVSGVLKHMIDGLVDAGIVCDDTPDHVVAEMPRIHAPAQRTCHRWLLTITRLA